MNGSAERVDRGTLLHLAEYDESAGSLGLAELDQTIRVMARELRVLRRLRQQLLAAEDQWATARGRVPRQGPSSVPGRASGSTTP